MEIDSETKKGRRLLLRLTAHFNRHYAQNALGSLSVAITGGDLRLDLSKIEFIKHHLYGELPLRVQRKTSQATSTSDKSAIEAARKPSASAEISAVGPKVSIGYGVEYKETEHRESANQQTKEISYDTFQVNALGGGTRPGWRFALKTGDPYLEGSIVDASLCECTINDTPSSINATFDVYQRFVKLEMLAGFPADIYNKLTPQLRRIFQFWVWHYYIKPKMLPHLSTQVINYE
jgi:hypothetical protein